jgi:uncharacterized protein with PIN domain
MIAVTVRFYAQLNDFLPARERQRRIVHRVAAPVSVKDAVEGLGVPHPEIDVILVDGQSVDFAHRLNDGDDVSVYPRFRSVDPAGLRRAGSDPPRPVRFAVDAHLGRLASLLRLSGFDTLLLVDDEEIARTAAREGRVVLTRDLALLKRGSVVHGRWVRHTDPPRQLEEVAERFDLVGDMEPFVRCLRCNTRLVATAAAAVADRLPPRVRTSFSEFRRCPGCDRIYWQGSHYDRLASIVFRLRERLAAPRAAAASAAAEGEEALGRRS